MNRKMAVIIILVVLLTMSSFSVLAGGGKVRGAKATGSARQVQMQVPPVPFP